MSIFDIFAKIKAAKTNEKMDILVEYDSPLLRKVLNYALDPYKVYGMAKAPKYTPTSKHATASYNEVFDVLDKILEGQLKGNYAIESVKRVLESLSKEDAYVFARIIEKDLKCGMGAKLINAAYEEEVVPTFDLMAAHRYEDGKKAVWPCWGEPKIDGMRCAIFLNEDGTVPYSRGGKEIEVVGDIVKDIEKLYPKGFVVDGEVVTAGAFEDAMSTLRRLKENAKDEKVFFHVFDVITIEEFENQTSDLTLKQRREQRFHKVDTEFVKANPYVVLNNHDEAVAFYEENLEKGLEGSILKNPNAPYEYKRSNHWLKMKPEETADLKIIGYYIGKEGTKNEKRLGGFIVEYNGSKGRKEVRVGGGLKEKDPTPEQPDLVNQRQLFWDNRDDMIGDIIEVEYMGETASGSMRHPRFVRLRSFKGEKI